MKTVLCCDWLVFPVNHSDSPSIGLCILFSSHDFISASLARLRSSASESCASEFGPLLSSRFGPGELHFPESSRVAFAFWSLAVASIAEAPFTSISPLVLVSSFTSVVASFPSCTMGSSSLFRKALSSVERLWRPSSSSSSVCCLSVDVFLCSCSDAPSWPEQVVLESLCSSSSSVKPSSDGDLSAIWHSDISETAVSISSNTIGRLGAPRAS